MIFWILATFDGSRAGSLVFGFSGALVGVDAPRVAADRGGGDAVELPRAGGAAACDAAAVGGGVTADAVLPVGAGPVAVDAGDDVPAFALPAGDVVGAGPVEDAALGGAVLALGVVAGVAPVDGAVVDGAPVDGALGDDAPVGAPFAGGVLAGGALTDAAAAVPDGGTDAGAEVAADSLPATGLVVAPVVAGGFVVDVTAAAGVPAMPAEGGIVVADGTGDFGPSSAGGMGAPDAAGVAATGTTTAGDSWLASCAAPAAGCGVLVVGLLDDGAATCGGCGATAADTAAGVAARSIRLESTIIRAPDEISPARAVHRLTLGVQAGITV